MSKVEGATTASVSSKPVVGAPPATGPLASAHPPAAKPKEPVHSEHPDATYIKRKDIGEVIAKGLAVMYKTQPKNPVDFLAKWLLNYAQVEKTALSV